MGRTKLSDLVSEEVEDIPIIMTETKTPVPTDPDWTEYVLSFLTKDERDEKTGLVKTDGLRRIFPAVMGPIYESDSCVIGTADSSNENRVTVSHRLVYAYLHDPNDRRSISDIADIVEKHMPYPFNKHLAACAATCAEGRALRKALCLGNVMVTEELEEAYEEGPIQDIQKISIEKKCKALKIDLLKFINMGEGKYESLSDVGEHSAKLMQKLLHSYSSGDKKIPEKILL